MRLVYMATGKPVAVGDVVTIRGETAKVTFFRPPRKPSSSGHVSVEFGGHPGHDCHEYYVGVIDAEWIEREDRT
jgi:hypothetical protein